MTKTAFLFPGQGAQSVGMGAELADSLPAAGELFARANEILGYDLLALCREGPAEQLDATNHAQPALYVCSLAAVEKLKQHQPGVVDDCDVAAGLSLGEYTALVFAGAIDFEAGLRLVEARGQAMQDAAEATPSGMVSVLGMERELLDPLVEEARQDDVLQVANLLCPGNIVVSGSQAACERIAPLAELAGAMKVVPLAVAGAFHTPIMQPAVERLTAALAEVEIRLPRIPVVSNVDGRPHGQPEGIRKKLLDQLVSPVLWEDCMRWMVVDESVQQFYEVGPGKVLRGLLKRINRKLPCESVEV